MGRGLKDRHHLQKGEAGQGRKPEVQITHLLFSETDHQILFPDGAIRCLIWKLIDQDHVEDGETDRDGNQEDLLAEKTRKKIESRGDRQPPVADPNQNFADSTIAPPEGLARIEESAQDPDRSQGECPGARPVMQKENQSDDDRCDKTHISQKERNPHRENAIDQNP